MLLNLTLAALRRTRCTRLIIAGGVSANGQLRARAAETAGDCGISPHIPPTQYCKALHAVLGSYRRGNSNASNAGGRIFVGQSTYV